MRASVGTGPPPAPDAAAAAGAAVRVSTALLLPQDRIPREPLNAWARRLHGAVTAARRECRAPAALSARVGGFANNAALIAAQRGDRAGAAALCEVQIRWQQRLSRRSRQPEIASRCVPPWVNLARLESLAGRWESAAARLERLRPRAPGAGMVLGPLRGDGMGCQHVPPPEGGFAEMVEAIYVIDTLRVLLHNRRAGESLEFCERVTREASPPLTLWAYEATMVAACLNGDYCKAWRAGREALRRDDVRGVPGLLFRLRMVEVAACAGEVEKARGALVTLAQAVLGQPAEAWSHLQRLYVLIRLAALCLETGAPEAAAALARGIYHGARAAGDEVFEMEALRVLAVAAPEPERAEWADRRRALEHATDYRQYRAQDAPPSDPAAFDALGAVLSGVFAH